MRKIILFELNEVPFKVSDHFCQWRPHSALARYLPVMHQVQTITQDKKLSPWTTWPTFHRGVTDQRHTIHEFGQELEDVDSEFPPIWKLLARSGVSVGVCGSLHSYPLPTSNGDYAFFVPDTFAASPECLPSELTKFQDFNLSMARESERVVSKRIDWRRAASVLLNSRSLGLRPSTYIDIGAQLLGETLQSWKHIRRRTYQSVLMFDVFMKQLREKRPAFSTFFTNHVASSMHRYWAATFPNDYASYEFTEEWQGTYRNEIEWTMSKFDAFFSELVSFAEKNPEYVIWTATSMGQAATVAKELETELMLKDLSRFMRTFGLEDSTWERRPAMIPQVNVRVSSHVADSFRAALTAFSIDGTVVHFEEPEPNFFAISFGQTNLHGRPVRVAIGEREVSLDQLGLEIIRIDDRCGATAYHVPQGSLLVYDPQIKRQDVLRTQIDTTALAPTILNNFGVKAPSYMTSPISGIL